MPPCCQTCRHRAHILSTPGTTPTLLPVTLIALTFTTPISNPNSPSPQTAALYTLLSRISAAASSTSHPTAFTKWSPCLSDPKTAVILTTASETCTRPTSPIFAVVRRFLARVPSLQHVLLDYAITSLAGSGSGGGERFACDVVVLRAPSARVAGAVGKRFGWDPKRSSLSGQMQTCGPAAFGRPGDLVRDFWAWAEIQEGGTPGSPGSPGSERSGRGSPDGYARAGLVSTNSEEKNMAMFFADDDDDDEEKRREVEDETLVMVFQWSSHGNADRFKHPLQKSYGQNGEEVSADLWDRHVAHPVRQLTGVGAKADMYRLELRDVDERWEAGVSGMSGVSGKAAVRMRSGSARLSFMANGLSERMSGLWK